MSKFGLRLELGKENKESFCLEIQIEWINNSTSIRTRRLF